MSLEGSLRRSFVTFAAVNASLGSFLFCYILTVFNAIQEILQDEVFPDASLNQISLLASCPYLGAFLGAIFIEAIGKRFGRRSTMILTKIISIIGVVLTLVTNLDIMIFGRFLTGFDGGASNVLVNIYIAEISEDPLRAQLGIIPNIASSMGIFLAFLLGTLLPSFISREVADVGCRVLLAIPGVVSLIIVLNLLFLFKFETPFYLVSQQKEKEAKEVLQLLYDDEHSAKLKQIILERDYILEAQDVPMTDLVKPKYRKAFLVSIVLAIAPSLMGGSVFLLFSNMIFSEGQTSYYSYVPILFANLMGIITVLGSLLILFLMRIYSKRRTYTIVGGLLFIIINLLLTIVSFTLSYGHMTAKILVILWTFVFGSTLGAISQLYPAETLPEIGVSVTTAVSSLAGFLTAQFFLPLEEAFGFRYLYLAFTVFSVIFTVYFWYCMIETEGRSKLEVLRLYGAGEAEEEKGALISREEQR